MKEIAAAIALALAMTVPAPAAEGDRLSADMEGGGISGTVTLRETASGAVHVEANLTGVPEGVHGFHVHETGQCDPDTGFKSAGGHFAGGLRHGTNVVGGPHPGDLPNVHAGGDGVVAVEYFTYGFTLGADSVPLLIDEDGAAVVLHAGADDYVSQPSGAAGDRLACGVLSAD